MTEKRHFHRVAHDAPAVLTAPGETWPCRVHDLSLKGCLLESDADWQLDAGHAYHLEIRLALDTRIDMGLELAHQDGRQAGFRCRAIDLDSITRLRRLVELNLGDSALLERDLRGLAGT